MTPKQAYDAMHHRAQQSQAEAIFLSIGDGAIVTDEHGYVVRANEQAHKILGYSKKELIGKWFSRTVITENEDGEITPLMDRPITRSFVNGKPVTEKTFYRRKDGSRVPVWLTVAPILLHNRPVGAVEVFRDISQEYEVDRMKSEFISIASHQLRTPLTAIMVYSHMLAEGYAGKLSDEQCELLNPIITAVERMNTLVSALLNTTRLEAGRIRLKLRKTNISELIQEVVREIRPEAEQKGIHLSSDIRTKDTDFQTDPLLTKEIMMNLLSNAIKYTPPAGTVDVSLYKQRNKVIFKVRDSGYGIPTEEQAFVFTKFFRGSNIKGREDSGTGLGLYTIKELANTMGGDLWFDSQENKGSTFFFSFPNYNNKEHEARVRAVTSKQSRSKGA